MKLGRFIGAKPELAQGQRGGNRVRRNPLLRVIATITLCGVLILQEFHSHRARSRQQLAPRLCARQVSVATAAMRTIHRVKYRLLLRRGLTVGQLLQITSTHLTTLLLRHLIRLLQHNHLYLISQRTTDL